MNLVGNFFIDVIHTYDLLCIYWFLTYDAWPINSDMVFP